MTSTKANAAELINILQNIMPAYPKDYWQLDTQLFGALPEFDSMAIVMLIGEIEGNFDIDLDDDDITEDNFATVGSVVSLIEG